MELNVAQQLLASFVCVGLCYVGSRAHRWIDATLKAWTEVTNPKALETFSWYFSPVKLRVMDGFFLIAALSGLWAIWFENLP